ncbi:hypothetical protein DMENIID0001_145470 [Sergentomyia squamirostris]
MDLYLSFSNLWEDPKHPMDFSFRDQRFDDLQTNGLDCGPYDEDNESEISSAKSCNSDEGYQSSDHSRTSSPTAKREYDHYVFLPDGSTQGMRRVSVQPGGSLLLLTHPENSPYLGQQSSTPFWMFHPDPEVQLPPGIPEQIHPHLFSLCEPVVVDNSIWYTPILTVDKMHFFNLNC